MVFSRRIRCHYCGARTAQSKTAGVRQFKCSACDAWNYLDENGEITDPPVEAIDGGAALQETFTTSIKPLPQTLDHQSNSPFCSTCQQNQRIYIETLSNYLPDDDHLQYHEYEKALPKFQADLEKRYPQICQKCSPQAQMTINRADHHAGAQNVAQLTRSQGGKRRTRTRDNWGKYVLRSMLNICGIITRLSVVAQVVWHAYSICRLTGGRSHDHVPRYHVGHARQCLGSAIQGHFNAECERSISETLPTLFLATTCLLWYNPGIKAFYHPQHRIEEVKGQAQYLYLQIILLLARSYSWLKLSNLTYTNSLMKQRLMAFHGTVILLISVTEILGRRLITPIVYQHHFEITPQPHERDIFAGVAGPDTPQLDAVASSLHPGKLLANDDPRPFPIWNLAPDSTKSAAQYPSPPRSGSRYDIDETDADAMDIDWQPSQHYEMPGAPTVRTFGSRQVATNSSTQPSRSLHSHGSTKPLGWGAMREETFRIQAQNATQAEHVRKEAEDKARLTYQPQSDPSPFRTRLPPAPMSMERRLRNPVTQVQFKKVPLSKQQDFMKQMRDGIESGKSFSADAYARHRQGDHIVSRRNGDEEDDDDNARPLGSPARSRTKGSLDLRQSTWTLPSDMATATGLEDLFGGNSFSIADGPALPSEHETESQRDPTAIRRHVLRVALPVGLLLIVWNIAPLRRVLCLWLVGVIDRLGL